MSVSKETGLPVLAFRWLTYQDPRGDSLPALGRVWDGFPRFAPDVIDDRDPPRRRFDTVEQGLADLAAEVTPGKWRDTTMYRFAEGKGRDRPILLSCTINAKCEYSRVEFGQGPDGTRTDVYPQFPAEYGGLIKPPMLDEPEAWDEFYELFKAVAVEVEAYFAYITPVDLANQFRGTGLSYLELSDVEWINWYGPALLEFWGGPERLAGVGFRQEHAPNGSLAVWATEELPVLDPTLKARANYPWKWPFYEAVGRETFYKPDPDKKVRTWEDQMALVGTRVPSPEAQRRHARQAPAEP